MKALAVRVGMWLPGWQIRGTTLAMPGALEAALGAMQSPLIYPFFMAEGWFTRTNLPRRLAAANAQDLQQLPPFGTDPALIDLIAAALPDHGDVLLAAHGSKVSRTSSDTTYLMARELEARGIGPITAAFVEEAPFLVDVAREMGAGTCIPFFALSAGHVVGDLPEALAEAQFDGPLLPPIGEDIGVARLIANALARAAA